MSIISPVGGFAPFGTGMGFNMVGTFPLARPAGIENAGGAGGAAGVGGVGGVTGVGSADGSSFGQMLADKIGQLNDLHQTSDTLAVKAVTGDLNDVHQYTIAANEAQVATSLAVNVRNKAVEAFTEIMRMSL